MDRSLTGFIRALRLAGVPASPAEAIDAARALALIGFADRATLKYALGVALAKTAQDKATHDRVFDMYHSLAQTDEAARAALPLQRASMQEVPPRTGQAPTDLGLNAHGGRSHRDELDAALRQAADQVGVDEIRFASQIPFFVRQILQALDLPALAARLGARSQDPTTPTPIEASALQALSAWLQGQAKAWVTQRFELFGQPATEQFMTEVAVHRPLGRMGPPDIERMKIAVARMAKRLAAKHSQRRRRRREGHIDLRRTLRANAGHDGVPFHLKMKQQRRDKPRLVVVCDVSGSVASHVRFLLLFLYALQGTVTDLRSFCFSHRLLNVDTALQTLPFDEAMDLILREVGGAATDYGQAWIDLLDLHADCIDRHTTLLILGDARSNHTPPRLDLFTQLADRAKRVVWLCNEPPARWGSGDSCMHQYRPLCTHVSHCASASDLERAIDEALEAYT